MSLYRDLPDRALSLTSETGKHFDLEKQKQFHMHRLAVSYLAMTDPMAAADWVLNHREDEASKMNSIRQSIILSAARTNPQASMTLLETFDLQNDPESLFSVGRGITLDSADQFLEILKEGKLSQAQKSRVLGGLASSPFLQNFDNAVAWFEKPGLTQEDLKSMTQGLHYESTGAHTTQWMEWLTRQDFTDTEIIEHQSRILKNWVRQDFASAGNWLNQQSESPRKHAAVRSYVEGLSSHEPSAAATWLVTLPGWKQETKLLDRLLQSYQRKSPEDAALFLQKHKLTSQN